MQDLIESTVSPAGKPSSVYTPFNIAEQTLASGFAFSQRLAKETGLTREDLLPEFFEGARPFVHSELASQLASESAGGASVGENSIAIWIADNPDVAGSEAEYIWMYFGRGRRVKLNAPQGGFPTGATLAWDLNQVGNWLEVHVETDLWDEIALQTDSTDGIRIERIRIRHSGQTILDWYADLWLDASRDEAYGRLVLTSKILETKLDHIGNLWVPQIHWAAREIGKTDGAKYGSLDAWCSEFASWCLQKAMWDTPPGNINSQDMEDYFRGLARMYTIGNILNGDYQLVAGDYIRFEWASGGHHSGLFIEYIDNPANPSDSTRIRTIEGNASATALVTTRELRHVLSVGNCQ